MISEEKSHSGRRCRQRRSEISKIQACLLYSEVHPFWFTHCSRNSSRTNLPIVVDVFCRQPIRCPSPVGEFLMGSSRSSYNHCLELGIYINVIVRWFIHASVVSYVKNNSALGSIKTIEHVALRSLRRELIRLTKSHNRTCPIMALGMASSSRK